MKVTVRGCFKLKFLRLKFRLLLFETHESALN